MKYHNSNFLNRLFLWSIPLCFFSAGTGMLMLLKVVNADGNFYTRIHSEYTSWIVAHIILLLGSILLLPASIGIRSLISNKKPGFLADAMVPIIAIAGALLSGQYAIDFLMPEIARLGGEAHEIHSFLSTDGLVSMLFYNLPELSSLGLLIMSIALVWDGRIGKTLSYILIINWLVVILGNLVAIEIQRIALFFLGITYVFIIRSLKD
ncbi:MAG: hypothetical protein HKN68_21305 [Saprospiraceae bacterium]|nr:hypothetical protein [Saprospiraceae bacterium]